MTENHKAEAAVLGCIMLDNGCLDDTILRPADFSLPSNAEIFKRMLELHGMDKPVDLVTLADGHSNPGYLASLETPTSLNFKTYEQAVKDASQRRAVKTICDVYDKQVVINPDLPDLLEGLEDDVLNINQGEFGKGFEVLAAGMMGHINAFDKIQNGQTPTGIKTGFTFIDRLTGGLQGGELIIIAARPGQGKTTLAMNICNNVAARRMPVSFLSLEMNDWALRVRMICSMAQVDSAKVRAAELSDQDKIAYRRCAEAMAKYPLHINDNSRTTLRAFKSQARRLVKREGVKLLVIDYLQLMETGERDESRRIAIDKISRNLKTLASDLNVPIICLSQLNRESDKDKRRPRLSDLKESGAIEQDADMVWLLYQKEPDDTSSELIIAKNRGGAVGIGEMRFIKEHNKFEGAEV